MANGKFIYSAAVIGCVVLVYALYALRRTGSDMGYEMTIFTRRALHAGTYGVEAMDALAKFRSELFKNTMAWQTKHKTSYASELGNYINYDAFKSFLPCPPDRPMTDYPGGDVPKPLCSISNLQAPCVIYSAGSAHDYTFEHQVLKLTPCLVHTFDCTIDGASQDPERHTFHKTCLGSAPKDHPNTNLFKHLQTVMKELGHTKVDIFKIDIEGYEYDVFQDWSETDINMPEQLSMELHYYWPKNRPDVKTVTRIPEMALLFAHLANLGYGLVGFQQNTWGNDTCCAEVGMLRVEAVQRVPVTIPAKLLGGTQESDQRRMRRFI